MKKLVLILLIIVGYSCIAQNTEDAYKDNTGIRVWPSDAYIPAYYEGEYQFFLDKLFWRIQNEYETATISLGIEVVSFPFIPDNFPNKSGIKSQYRNLNVSFPIFRAIQN